MIHFPNFAASRLPAAAAPTTMVVCHDSTVVIEEGSLPYAASKINFMSDDLAFAVEFPAATREQWVALASRVLKGRPFESLTARTPDGIAIEPLHGRAHDGARIASRAGRWQVMARVDHPHPAAANAQALEDLEGGANGLVLVGTGSVGAHGYGLMPETITRVLDGVLLDAGIAIEFDLSPQTKDLPLALGALVKERGIAPASLGVRIGFDPLGASVYNGGFPLPWAEFAPHAAKLAADLAAQGFKRALMVADGRVVHGAGGTEAQELAYAIAVAVAYLRALEAHGIALDDARRMIFFRLAADADQFLTIAKFRALRTLWARVEASCGLAPEPAFIAAETAWRMMTRNDPQVNILRSTIATFAAAIGGANSITVLPFTTACGLPDAFARRVARNTQLVLIEEAGVARVADPSAGTGWSEQLTADLCATAWALFQEIERGGGVAVALEQGLIQRKVQAARAERERSIATRKDALVGANEFPDLREMPVAVLNVARTSVAPMPVAIPTEPLAQMRLAEPYEALRDASDHLLAATGARPKVFLANLGASADFTERATFATNFFAAGGIEAIGNDGFANREALVKAFKASGARLACLCGTNPVYDQEAADTARALKAGGARRLYLIGRPGEHEAPWQAAGIDTFLHAGCDALAILQSSFDH
jgi:methylmalonyl-CoA mutase